jgi:plastocyanin
MLLPRYCAGGLRRAALGIAVFLVIAAIAPRARAEEPMVKIDNFTFNPPTLTVKAGTTTVASDTKVFKSKALDTDDSYTFTFTTAGVYEYFCSLHPHMKGTIVVEAKTGSN